MSIFVKRKSVLMGLLYAARLGCGLSLTIKTN